MTVYASPRLRDCGDAMMGIEFADEVDLGVSFRLLALDLLVNRAPPIGVTETIPTTRTLGVVFDPLATSAGRLGDAVLRLWADAAATTELPSRVVTIPVWYDDPSTREAARAEGVGNNLEAVAAANGISTADVIRLHSGSLHWVTHLGFTPGCFAAYPLDAATRISAPKFERPRQSTPARVIAVGGICTTIYPIASPGGYQMLGRTPLELYDPKARHPAFGGGVALTRAGDRHRYVPIGEDEYRRIRAAVEAGSHDYEVEEGTARWPETFSKS